MNDMLIRCPNCKAGILIQLADADRDVAYCPECEAIIPDCIAGREEKVPEEV